MTDQSTHNINTLRSALFETLAGLRAGTVTADQARAINAISHTIVETAKVELDYLRITDSGESPFLAPPTTDTAPPALPNGITGIVRHRLA